MSHTNRELVEFYLNYKLSHSNFPTSLRASADAWQSPRISRRDRSGASPSSDAGRRGVKAVLRKVTDDFEKKLTRACGDLSSYLPSKISHQNFNNTMDQIFEGNVHWGVVIGLFVVGGAMCVQCVRNNHEELVCHIADWMTAYLDEHLEPWIQRQGGWVSVEDRLRKAKRKNEKVLQYKNFHPHFLQLFLIWKDEQVLAHD